jgi:two-component system, NarL family, response regulator DegU
MTVSASAGRRDGSGVVKTAPLSPATPDPHLRDIESLSPRECEVLQMLADGHSTVETADFLGVTRSTLMTHRQNILRKLGTSSMIRAVVLGLQSGVIE